MESFPQNEQKHNTPILKQKNLLHMRYKVEKDYTTATNHHKWVDFAYHGVDIQP